MSAYEDIKELCSQVRAPRRTWHNRCTQRVQGYGKGAPWQVENALSEINRLNKMIGLYKSLSFEQNAPHLMNEKLIAMLKAAKVSAENYRSTTNMCDTRQRLTEHIEELKAAIKTLEHGVNTPLAPDSEEEHNQSVSSERQERENNQLAHAMHGLEKELIRATGELRSALLVLIKSDLRIEKVEMKVSELTGTVNEVKTTTLKVLAEVRARVDLADARIVTLEAQLADADVPEAATTALAELKTIVGQLDDITPDAPELPPVTPPVVTPP